MQTGENTHELRKIMDFTRMGSMLILAIHFYSSCYQAFTDWHLTAPLSDRILANLLKLGMFKTTLAVKGCCLLLLAISLIGVRGRKDDKIHIKTLVCYIILGLLLYAGAELLFYLPLTVQTMTVTYMSVTIAGYLLILSGGAQLSRLIRLNLVKDIFNKTNETFPQQEELLENDYSINLPARYTLKDKVRDSWINIINPFRGSLIIGSPGAGKSYFVIRHIITQHIKKGFTIFLYDFKFDDLTKIAYNTLLQHHHGYKTKPQFYVINFDDLNRTHRCNPLEPQSMDDLTDATEASRSIFLGLNRDWIRKQGDFFVESPINFVTAVIWFLRKYQGGKYCTLPHVIELMLTGILLVVTILKSFAQDAAGAKASFVQPYHLAITYSKTTNLVFPYPIKSVDRGSRDVLIQKPEGIENVLQLKAAKQGFPETNLTVVTADGNLFSYVINYAESPATLSILFQDGRTASKQVAVFTKDATTDEIERVAQRVENKERTVDKLKSDSYSMLMDVKGIYIHDDVIYFQLELKNNSAITYDVQSLRFYILDKKRIKRTATQETDMQPLYVLGNQDRIRSASEQTITVAVPKFTIADKKYLNVELMEKNGGRNLSFKINNKDIMKARPI